MKLFIWKRLEDITDYYHNGGAVLATGEHWHDVVPLIKRYAYHDQWDKVEPIGEPDVTLELADGAAAGTVLVFPDSGCC